MVVEVQELREPDLQFDALARVEHLRIERAQRAVRFLQVRALGRLTIPFEVDAADDEAGRGGGHWTCRGLARGLQRALVLPEVVQPPRLRQGIGAGPPDADGTQNEEDRRDLRAHPAMVAHR